MKYWPTITVTLLIIIAVLLPGRAIPGVGIFQFDKLVHFIMFFVWATAVRRDFPSGAFSKIIITGLVFSFFTEVLQIVAEDRTFDLYDMLADAVGLIVGLWLAPYVLRIVKI